MDSTLPKIFNVFIVGDGGCGKTSLVDSMSGKIFEGRYLPTCGGQGRNLSFNTSAGRVILNCWDWAGQEKFSRVRKGYYRQSDAFIVMFSTDSNLSFESSLWYKKEIDNNKIPTVLDDDKKEIDEKKIPIILVGNKIDSKDRKISESKLSRVNGFTDKLLISVKKNHKNDAPFLSVIRCLLGDQTIVLIPP